MRAQQGASEGESDTGFPFFMSDFFMPDARRPAAPDVGNTGYLISEVYAAGSPVCLTPVSGVRRMFGHPMPVVCRIADFRSVCGRESEAPGGGVWGHSMPDSRIRMPGGVPPTPVPAAAIPGGPAAGRDAGNGAPTY